MREDIKIDPEFKNLLPPLSPEAYQGLEQNLKDEGCKDALTVWNGFLIDGHHRFEICNRLNIPFRVNYSTIPDRDSVLIWMLDLQMARRNLHDVDMIKSVAMREDLLAKQAQERMKMGGGDKVSERARAGVPTSAHPVGGPKTRDAAAKLANVGHTKYEQGKMIHKAVADGIIDPSVIDKIRAKETTINAESKKIKALLKPLPEPEESKPITSESVESYRPCVGMEITERAIMSMERIHKQDKEFVSGHQKMLDYCTKVLTKTKAK